MQKQSFAHLVATIGPLVAAALAALGYFGHHQIIAYVACIMALWKRAYVEDVISSIQGTVTVAPQSQVSAPIAAGPQPRIKILASEAKAELARLEATANQATAEKNAGYAEFATLKG